jgi:hypothetical protein
MIIWVSEGTVEIGHEACVIRVHTIARHSGSGDQSHVTVRRYILATFFLYSRTVKHSQTEI